MPDEKQKRLVAKKIFVKEIFDSKYVSEEGFNPSYLVKEDGAKISRINLIAVVVDKEKNESYSSIILDDGTGKISARSFEENGLFERINVGEIALVVGRPREYGAEKYVLPEIIKKIENVDWFKLRKMEICEKNNVETAVGEVKKVAAEVKKDNAEKVIEFIKNEDHGKGVDVREILKNGFGEKWVNKLLENGEIFEISPGRVKLLE